jgi:hypothetical protein
VGNGPRRIGPGRVLVWVYGLFVIAAGARGAVQLSTHGERARLAYVLSAVAAGAYLVGFVLVRRVERGAPGESARRVALCWCGVELVGVASIGTLSLARSSSFPDATVWGQFGRGYGFVPVLLPMLAALWLRCGHEVD